LCYCIARFSFSSASNYILDILNSRVNEYGQCAQPTEEMLQEIKMTDGETNDDESTNITNKNESSTTLRRRRGARDKKLDLN
jgi:hypothetical protein